MIALITHRGQQAPSFNQTSVSLKTFFFHNRSKPQPNLSLPIAFFLASFLYSKTAKSLTYNCTVPDTEREGGLETRSSTNFVKERKMENGGNKGQENDHANLPWDIWELNTSRFDLVNSSNNTAAAAAAAAATATDTFFTTTATSVVESGSSCTHPEGTSAHGFLFPYQNSWLYHHSNNNSYQQLSLYAGDGSNLPPDPHLMCLKLGKRHYFENSTSNNNHNNHPVSDRHEVGGFSIGKRGKPYYSVGGGGGGAHDGPSSSTSVNVPRCQVEGCHVALLNAKDYHRRHKVCEVHSKAPKVIVLGLEQRFCQQCSRFHVVSEFDDAKRSCRRRLAGHNERRRKSSQDPVSRNSSQEKLMVGRFPYIASPTGCALSLLSSKADSWVSPSDLSSRSSAALRELIAEHRTAILARQLVLEKHLHHHAMEDLGESQPSSNILVTHQQQVLSEPRNWGRLNDTSTHVTLDLMQAPSSAFGFLSPRGKNKEEEEGCSELWSTMEGAHVV